MNRALSLFPFNFRIGGRMTTTHAELFPSIGDATGALPAAGARSHRPRLAEVVGRSRRLGASKPNVLKQSGSGFFPGA